MVIKVVVPARDGGRTGLDQSQDVSLELASPGAVTGHQRFGRFNIGRKAMSRPDSEATRQSEPRNVRLLGSSMASVIGSHTRHGLLVFENRIMWVADVGWTGFRRRNRATSVGRGMRLARGAASGLVDARGWLGDLGRTKRRSCRVDPAQG